MPCAEVRVAVSTSREIELRCRKIVDFLPIPGRQVILHDEPLITGTTVRVVDSVADAPPIVEVQATLDAFEKLCQILQNPRSDGATKMWTYWEKPELSLSKKSEAA